MATTGTPDAMPYACATSVSGAIAWYALGMASLRSDLQHTRLGGASAHGPCGYNDHAFLWAGNITVNAGYGLRGVIAPAPQVQPLLPANNWRLAHCLRAVDTTVPSSPTTILTRPGNTCGSRGIPILPCLTVYLLTTPALPAIFIMNLALNARVYLQNKT